MVVLADVVHGIEQREFCPFLEWIHSHHIDSYCPHGRTLLSQAIRTKSKFAVSWLLKQGADPNVRERNGALPLYLAIHLKKFCSIVHLLVKNGANLDLINTYETPLTVAIEEGQHKMVDYLLRNGADPYKCNMQRLPPVFVAIKENQLLILEIFMKHKVNMNIVDHQQNTPIVAAIRYKSSLEIIFCLLSYGINVNRSRNEKTPIEWALVSGRLKVVELLLNSGADINRRGLGGNRSIVSAVRQGNLKMVEFLLEKGANADEKSADGDSLLMIAARRGCIEIIQVLLNHQADIEKLNLKGNTALAIAVQCKQFQVVSFLVDNGADFNTVGPCGKTPLQWAIYFEDIDMIHHLFDLGANRNFEEIFMDAVVTENLVVVDTLVQMSSQNLVSLAVKRKTGKFTPLVKALELENFALAKYLIGNGANVVEDLFCDEISWINEFLEKWNIELVKLLTENGARLDEFDEFGETALTEALLGKNFGMVKYFVEKGADVNQMNRKGFVPLQIAKMMVDFDSFQYLVEAGASFSEEYRVSNQSLGNWYQMAKHTIEESRRP